MSSSFCVTALAREAMLIVTAASTTTTEVASPTSSDVEAQTEDADETADLVSKPETEVGGSDGDAEEDAEDDAEDDVEDDAEDDDEDDDADLVRNPGVRLIGRRVRKLYADPSQPDGYKLFGGTVIGSRVDKTWGTVYGVRYEDGEEQEVIYEELIPILDEPDEKQRAVPLAVIEASTKARTKYSLEKHFPRKGFRPGTLRKEWVGVRRDPDHEGAFFGVATDPRTKVVHHFDVIFTTRHAAGAAHDLLVRRMRAVAAKPRNFIGWEQADAAPAANINTRGKRKENVDFEEVNFPDASWSDLCGIVLGTVATKLTRVVRAGKPPENQAPDSHKRPTPAAPPPAPPAEKKKRRDPRAPRRVNVGGRVYDSRLGVTCHWCRQKTHEAHVTCTSPSCALPGSRLAVSFCGQCLKNRNGEDVFAARESGRWVCPRCRGSCGPGCASCCNCGPCRVAAGLKPTGPGIASAFAAGFGNVHDFLVGRETGEGREAVARRKLGFPWGAWLAPRNEASPSTATHPAAREATPPAPPAMLPMAPSTPAAPTAPTAPTAPATPTTPAMPLATVARRGLVVPAAASASAAVADLRRALGDAKAMVAEGLLDDEDFGKIKTSVLAGIAFGAGADASSAGA